MIRPLARLVVPLLMAGFAVLAAQAARADFDTFTDESDFLAALPAGSETTTTTFDDMAAGLVVVATSPIDGIGYEFTPLVPGDQLQVATGFDTTSSPNYLGSNVAGNFNQITAGDEIDFTFDAPSHAFGLFIITADPVFDGDILLVTSQGTAAISSTPQFTLADGGAAYFIGFSSDVEVDGVQLRYGSNTPSGSFFFVIDDVTRSIRAVPEPGSLAILGTGVIALALASSRRHRR